MFYRIQLVNFTKIVAAQVSSPQPMHNETKPTGAHNTTYYWAYSLCFPAVLLHEKLKFLHLPNLILIQ